MYSTTSKLMSFENAQEDFHNARRKAALQEILARISGKSSNLLSYDDVRAKLGGIESAYYELKDIPLDAIIGTVSRYSDFNRQLLPLKASDQDRWARVRLATENMEGLPPIEVYQIGDAYFILDGHHRASVAREMGSDHIQAYVRRVRTLVPVSPTDRIDDIILKSEYIEFLKKTRLNEIRPDSNVQVTVPGEYDTLLEHISVHRYFMGIDEKRDISYEEAVGHWYDQVYEPVARIIRQRNILKDFPERSEADLYLWVMDHRSGLEEELGWKVNPQTAANDLSNEFRPKIENAFYKVLQRIFNAITPDEIEPSVPPGEWRHQRDSNAERQGLFHNILVALPDDAAGWKSVDLAINVASNEHGFLGGLHMIPTGKKVSRENLDEMVAEFTRRCAAKGIEGRLVVETGNITKILFDRSTWADLLVLRMLFPPPLNFIKRLRSGLRTLIRLSRVPLLLYPPDAEREIKCAVLAYGGGPRADEALYVATYLSSKWNLYLTVVTVDRDRRGDDRLAERAKAYLSDHGVDKVDFRFEKGDPANIILQTAEKVHCDLVIMGGYESGLFKELVLGSTVDRVLWSAKSSVLICQ